MSSRLFLYGDYIVSPLFLSLRWLDGFSGSAGCLFPPSSTSMDDWLILASSELVTSVSRRQIQSLPFMARPHPDQSAISYDYSRSFCQPHLLQRPSGIVSWATYRPLPFSYLTGCSEWGCSSLASRINGISWTTSFRSPGSLSVESLLLWWTRVAQLREGVSFSSPVQEVSFLSDASDVGCRPS